MDLLRLRITRTARVHHLSPLTLSDGGEEEGEMDVVKEVPTPTAGAIAGVGERVLLHMCANVPPHLLNPLR